MNAKTCSRCQKAIETNTYTVGQNVYCKGCFVCGSCGKGLPRQTILPTPDPHVYLCTACFKCDKCQKLINPGDEHLQVGNLKLHTKCLSCSHPGCGKNLASRKIWKLANGLPACEAHNGQ